MNLLILIHLQNALSSAMVKSATATDTVKKPKGRTGWPQHVWASELKTD